MTRRSGRGGRSPRTEGPRDRSHADSDLDLIDESELEFSIDELRDFLSADLLEVPADPAFQHRLREKLWELIRSGAFGYGGSPTTRTTHTSRKDEPDD